MSRFDRYMGIPFVDEGADFSGCNCLGLYALILAREAQVDIGIALDARATLTDLADRVAAALATGRWTMVATGDGAAVRHKARMFDAIEMTVPEAGRAPLHIGCALGDGMMIHTERGAGPRCLPIDHRSVARRIVAVWRPHGLTEQAA